MNSDIKPYERKTYYYETDQMGIIHHSNYIKWMEEARLDFLRQIDLPYNEVEQLGLLVPVLGISCKYMKAFRYGDTFQIKIKLTEFGGIKFCITYEIYNADTGELHATAASAHGFVDKNLIPVRMKKEYPEIYQKLLNYVEQNID